MLYFVDDGNIKHGDNFIATVKPLVANDTLAVILRRVIVGKLCYIFTNVGNLTYY